MPGSLKNDLTVAELIARYWRFAKGYYVKNGRPTGWQVHIRLVIRMLKETYGPTLAADFGPLALKAFRQRLIDAGHSRKYINKLVAIVPRLFKWGVAEELVPSSVDESLRAVEGLRKGRCTAPETKPVLPVADTVVDATLPHLPPIVADDALPSEAAAQVAPEMETGQPLHDRQLPPGDYSGGRSGESADQKGSGRNGHRKARPASQLAPEPTAA